MGQDNIKRTDSIFTIAGLSPDVIEERVMKKTYGVSVASRAIPEVGTALWKPIIPNEKCFKY